VRVVVVVRSKSTDTNLLDVCLSELRSQLGCRSTIKRGGRNSSHLCSQLEFDSLSFVVENLWRGRGVIVDR